MAINTTNYNLVKQEQTDAYDVDVFNGNIDIIDAIMKLNERTYERIKLDVSTSTVTSLTAWDNLSSTVKFSQGYILSDKSLSVQWHGGYDNHIKSALFTMYLKSSGAGGITFYVANVDDDVIIYDGGALHNNITSTGEVYLSPFSGVKIIKILVNNTGEDISCNFGGLVNAVLCDESEYTG